MNRISFSSINNSKRRIIAAAAAVFMIAALLISPFMNILEQVAASAATDSVIIQLKDDPAAVWRAKQQKAGKTVTDADLAAYRASLKTKQDQFLSALTAKGIAYQLSGVDVPDFTGAVAGHVDFRYTMVLNGMSLKVPTASVAATRSMPEVKNVQPNAKLHVELEKSVDYIRAPQVYGKFQELTPFDMFNEGYEGQGMYVAVLDTGIDWTNPMFGGDPTPPRLGLAPVVSAVATNQKVVYYLPLTAGFADDFGHGSHASADIAGYLATAPGADKLPGTADDARLHGVAPQAKLMGYKVCAGVGSCLAESTILGLEDAVSPTTLTGQPKPIAHVINMSLGGAGGPNDATAVASDNAALTGTIVVAAAGNDGPGEATVGSPAAGRHTIAAGANTDPGGGAHTTDFLGNGGRTGMISNLLEGAAEVTSDITSNYVYCGLAETPADCPADVKGKIALIARGSTYNLPALPAVGSLGTGLFSNKAASAAASGAIAALIYNNVDGELSAATVRASTIPVLGISKENGEYLKNLIGSGTVSAGQVRINAAKAFAPEMADFSSRGPVQGLGQVKPDITAPGVDIYSATVRVGGAETNTATMFDPTGFIHASGTSFSCPHTAGAATLIKQAHLDWSPDMVRTALINTATNLRSSSGTPKTDATADSIIAQGGGLIDVYGAVNTKALMGIAGDGIVQPGILGSYSFGEAPILNNRIVNTRSVTVTIRDVSGQGGVYNLSTANNRYFDRAGITASVPSSVTVPAGGQATFTASFSVDGNQVRDNSPLELQWYVVATPAGGGRSIHMPMYFRANPSLPGANGGSSTTDTYTGNVLAGDASAQHDAGLFVGDGVTYNDVPVEVGANTVGLSGNLAFSDAGDTGVSDLDLYLVNPAGEIIGSSTTAGGPENISVPVSTPGTYIWRVYGWVAANTPYTLTSTQTMGGTAPTLNPIAADFVSQADGSRVDFDGSISVTWQAAGGADSYELEESTDGTNWNVVQSVPASSNGVSFSNLADGTYSFRVRSIVPGKIGKYVTPPSNVASIIVAHRTEVDATPYIDAINRSIVFPGGSTEIVMALKNNSQNTFYPNIRFEITGITSTGNTVRANNADNGGDGVRNAASYDYSQLVGADFVTGEESGNKTLKFSNPNNQMFNFTAKVYANTGSPAGSGGSGGSSSASTGGTSGGSGSNSGLPAIPLTTSKLLKFTVNPLTKTVTVQLLN
ncbi:MAG: S8 family serine peptidase [Acidobacteria bacterium]|nr:S8 family serine peptidase [Acidobacteriota bacterium]